MAYIVVVTSGKGGVGKTTTAASFAAGLASRGYKTVVVDFDIGLRNLDLIMGCEQRVVFDFIDVIHNYTSLDQALIRDRRDDNLWILAASQTRDKDALTDEGVERVLRELSQKFDYVICDSPAGIERGALCAMYFADEAILVTNPEISSVRDADRVLGLLSARTRRAERGESPVLEHLLVTRYAHDRVGKGEMLSLNDICDILTLNLLGVIPESEAVLNASNAGRPVVLDGASQAGAAYDDMVARFLGETRPINLTAPRKGLFGRLRAGRR